MFARGSASWRRCDLSSFLWNDNTSRRKRQSLTSISSADLLLRAVHFFCYDPSD
jgi:hypothetical protein